MFEEFLKKLHWLGHDCFRIDAQELVIYIDPYQLKGTPPPADLILITHDHFDHCSPDDVAKIQKGSTLIVTIAQAAAKLKGKVTIVKPGDEVTVHGVQVRAIPAYNVNKFREPGKPFHPKEVGHVGFMIDVDGVSLYHTGDSDVIPEMQGLKPDIALIPVSGTYVMTADEAVEAVKVIQPKLAIPMHVGAGIGTMDATAQFKAASTVPVQVLKIED